MSSKLNKTLSTCGRWVQKPETAVKADEVSEETIPIQDQIENLRSKIFLRERYNRVLKDELEESRQGAATVLQDLYRETIELRHSFIEAVDAEKFAVQNALRTHREFQLALLDKPPSDAIGWLDDKLFDNAKRLNSLMDRLQEKRSKLEEAENMVLVIEKWPRPGTLPWELAANLNFARIENMVEAVDVKRETAQIMNLKYKDIKMTLSEERGKYAPNLRNLETQLNYHKQEIKNLEKMQEDATKFKDEAAKNYSLTEIEASQNRKKRRKQMAKMKKAVQRVMEANQVKKAPAEKYIKLNFDQTTTEKSLQNVIAERIDAKRAEVEKFQDRARRLVETMRVPDLTHIPQRLITVMELGNRLTEELESKENLRDLLIRQKNQLMLILCHYKYTGQARQSEYQKTIEEHEKQISNHRLQMEERQAKLKRLGDITSDIRLGVVALTERIEGSRSVTAGPSTRHSKHDLKMQLRLLNGKCKRVIKSAENLQSLFEGEETDKNYAAYVKPPPLPGRLIRVGSPVVSDGSDEEDYSDFKVPSRQEIKARSKKFIQQSLIRRGLR